MVAHNNMIQREHFHKQWWRRVKTWFDQPARKLRRRQNRLAKARRAFPRPIDGPLRPAVHPPTQRYSAKLRAGRGFTLDELHAAKINPRMARRIGISVDRRRRDHSEETLRMNVNRLNAFMKRMILFPLNPAKPGPMDAKPEQLKSLTQVNINTVLPIRSPAFEVYTRKITEKEKKMSAFMALRQARATARNYGHRKVLAEAKKAEQAKKDA
eukprot:m51a1_g5866 putative 60S ribosomal protein L13e (212) ;mRNA; f:394318-395197